MKNQNEVESLKMSAHELKDADRFKAGTLAVSLRFLYRGEAYAGQFAFLFVGKPVDGRQEMYIPTFGKDAREVMEALVSYIRANVESA